MAHLALRFIFNREFIYGTQRENYAAEQKGIAGRQ